MDFLLVLLLFPLLSFLIGIIGQVIFKKASLVVSFIFLLWLILTFTVFNSSFLIWIFVYTILAFLGTLIECKSKTVNQKIVKVLIAIVVLLLFGWMVLSFIMIA